MGTAAHADAALWHTAQAKIPQAVAELSRRERLNMPLRVAHGAE